EKLQPLVRIAPPLRLRRRQRADMGQGADEQRSIGEIMADARLQGGEIAAGGLRSASIHLTAWNMRLRRRSQGQRQNCQAGAPSPTEKKITSARPSRFSNGT